MTARDPIFEKEILESVKRYIASRTKKGYFCKIEISIADGEITSVKELLTLKVSDITRF